MIKNLEVCTFNTLDFKKAIKYNVSRIEFCSNKEVGGITPSFDDLQLAVNSKIPIHPIIRPRAGNFIYDKYEINKMIESIRRCKEIGCAGIVVGALNFNNEIDISSCKKFINAADGMSSTFHLAFDLTSDVFESMEKIIDLGFQRILTSGKQTEAIKGKKLIEKLAQKSQKRISIMPGLKLRSSNIDYFLNNNLFTDFHSSCYINEKFCEEELQSLLNKIKAN